MKRIQRNRGFTLIELIVSIAILGIIVVSFSSLFLQGFTTVFAMGNKTRAMAAAQKVMDKAYEGGSLNINTSLAGISSNSTDAADFDTYEEAKPVKHFIDTQAFTFTDNGATRTVSFTRLSVKVYYQNGNRNVILVSFIP